MKTATMRATHLSRGDLILGRRDFHLKIERVIIGARRVTVEGVNGWGEGMTMRYRLDEKVELILDDSPHA